MPVLKVPENISHIKYSNDSNKYKSNREIKKCAKTRDSENL